MLTIDLTDKLALITGASGQLGRVMARTLADAGADIVIHFHNNASGAESLLQEIHDKGRRGMTVQADVTDKAGIEAMRDEVRTQLHDPDIILNNAVIQYDWTSVLEQDEADYESQFRSCVLQNVMMAKVFVPAMISTGWGRVIGINTECAMQCSPGQSAYVSGKRGMDGVLRVLAKEVGSQGVTVNQVAPGWTISENSPVGTGEDYAKHTPMKRRGYDYEIANVVAFLASDLAGYITGAYVPVCGGNVMPTI